MMTSATVHLFVLLPSTWTEVPLRPSWAAGDIIPRSDDPDENLWVLVGV